MKLKQGYKFDKMNNTIVVLDYKVVLSRLESELLKFLASKDRCCTFDEIQRNVWGNRKMSNDTLRNFVNKIRNKTYREIIKNHSGVGYSFNQEV